MTFDLHFWREPGLGPVTNKEAIDIFSGRPHIESDDDDLTVGGFVYYNPDTEVYFRFELDKASSGAGERPDESGRLVVSAGTTDLADSGLSFRMNLCRPSYFADEAFPVVVEIATGLGLRVEDVSTSTRSAAIAPDAGELARAWRERNDATIAILRKKGEAGSDAAGPMRFEPRATLDAFWRYMSQRRAIQRGVAGELYAPTVFLLREKGRERSVGDVAPIARRTVVWNAPGPLLLPEVDLVHIVGPGDAEDRIVPRAIVEELLGDRLEAVADTAAPLRRYDGRDRASIEEKLAALALGNAADAYYECEPDSFIDTPAAPAA